MKTLVLFDIDGTLVQTGGAGGKALTRACIEICGFDDAARLFPFDGMTDRKIVREILCQKEKQRFVDLALEAQNQRIDQILNAYLRYLEEEIHGAAKYEILPGIEHVLAYCLEQEHIVLGLTTGNVKKGAQIKLTRGNIYHYFPFGGFGCDHEDRGEIVAHAIRRANELSNQSIDPERIFVIGDTPHDIDSGRKNNARTIGVATGSFDENQLANYKPNYLFKNFSQVEKIIDLFQV